MPRTLLLFHNANLVTRHQTREPFFHDGQPSPRSSRAFKVKCRIYLAVPPDTYHSMAYYPLANRRHIEANFVQAPQTGDFSNRWK